jgi:hypothetical protein
VVCLPNGIIALCLPDRINFRDSKDNYKSVRMICPIQGWSDFQRLFVLSKNDLALSANPGRVTTIIIYNARSDYESFKVITDGEALTSIISLNDNKCAILTFHLNVRIYDYKDCPICVKAFGYHNIKSLLFVPKSNLLFAGCNEGIQVINANNDEFNCVITINMQRFLIVSCCCPVDILLLGAKMVLKFGT